MFIRETIQCCNQCQERTPHSWRTRLSLSMCFALFAALFGIGCSILLQWWPVALLSFAIAAFAFSRDRERGWHIACERCRGKQVAELRKTKPTLDGRTEIQLF